MENICRRIRRWLGLERLERRIEFLEREVYGEPRSVSNSPTVMEEHS